MLGRAARRAVELARPAQPQLQAALRSTSRAAFVARTKLAAQWVNATVDLQVADDVRIGRGVKVTFEPWSHNTLHIGAKTTLGDRVLIQLKGGEVRLGERVDVRRDCLFNVAGRLEIQGDNVISWSDVVHCSNAITIGRMVIIGEHTTLVDSSHFFTAPDDPVWHNVRRGTLTIGSNTWIGAKATLTRDVTVGEHCIVGASAVVTSDVPSGSLATGSPATHRPLSLPWA